MSGLFIGTIIVAVVAALLLLVGRAVKVAGRRNRNEDAEGGGKVLQFIGTGVAVIAVVMLFFSLFARVGTNRVGIVTSFGKPVTAHQNGWHGKAPWQKVTIFDGSRQFLRLDGNSQQGSGDNQTFPKAKVRLDGNATADITGTITWQMRAETAEEKARAVQLFRNYRTFDRVREKFVYPGVTRALGEVFADFNPLVAEKNLSLAQLNERALTAIRAQFAGQLDVISVDLRVPDYDQTTDSAIQALQTEKQRTETAKQKEQTNKAEAEAAKALASAQQQVPSREVLINKCLDIAKEQGKEPGYCFLQGGTPLVGAK